MKLRRVDVNKIENAIQLLGDARDLVCEVPCGPYEQLKREEIRSVVEVLQQQIRRAQTALGDFIDPEFH